MNNLQLVNAILYVLENGTQSIGCSRGGLTTQIHRVTASDRSAVSFSLSAGNAADRPEGRKLLNFTAGNTAHRHLLMDCALASSLGYTPVVPPKKIAKSHGNMTINYTGREMKSNVSSCVLSGSEESSPVTTSWISYSQTSFYSQ